MNRSKLLKSFAILGAVAALSLTAANAEAKVLKSSQKKFYVTLNGDGSKTTITKVGTLTVFAQCERAPLGEEGEDEVKIVVKNSKGPWVESEDGKTLKGGQRLVLLSESDESGESTFEDEDGSVATKSGLYVTVEAGLGVNVFGHDCVAIGTVTSITGKP